MKNLCLLMLAASVLTGCSGWLIGETPRLPTMRILVDHAEMEVSDQTLPQRLVINRPAVSPTLQTRAILVTQADGSLTQVSSVLWSDQPGRMLQRRLAERLAASRRFADVSTDSYRPADEILLHVSLLRFDIEESADGLQAIGIWELRLPGEQLEAERIAVRQMVDGTGADAMMRTLQQVGQRMVVEASDAILAVFAEH